MIVTLRGLLSLTMQLLMFTVRMCPLQGIVRAFPPYTGSAPTCLTFPSPTPVTRNFRRERSNPGYGSPHGPRGSRSRLCSPRTRFSRGRDSGADGGDHAVEHAGSVGRAQVVKARVTERAQECACLCMPYLALPFRTSFRLSSAHQLKSVELIIFGEYMLLWDNHVELERDHLFKSG